MMETPEVVIDTSVLVGLIAAETRGMMLLGLCEMP